MKMKQIALIHLVATCFVVWSSGPVLADYVTFDWATVRNPSNAGESQPQGTFGAVDYNYRISKHEVTNAQYTTFLNVVAATDTHSLYNTLMGSNARGGITRSGSSGSYTYSVKADMANKSVNYVSFFDAMRFTNWLENGQGASDTEAGVYTIGNGLEEVRNPSARFFITSEDEWYKAAYHKNDGVTGNYWDYPTSSDTAPTVAMANTNGDVSNPGINVANYVQGADWNGQNGNVTTVGSATSTSPYGTFDQGGNVWEWNEAVIDSFARGYHGGNWLDGTNRLAASDRSRNNPTSEDPLIGFRVASPADPQCNVQQIAKLLSLATPRLKGNPNVLCFL